MKSILATALILALGITGISLWGAAHERQKGVSSSQLLIHGTPVCVIRQGGEILASVGFCARAEVGRGDEEFDPPCPAYGGPPSHLETHPALPPGHPPVDVSPNIGGGRRILI